MTATAGPAEFLIPLDRALPFMFTCACGQYAELPNTDEGFAAANLWVTQHVAVCRGGLVQKMRKEGPAE